MSRTRFSKLILAASTLAVCASSAFGQTLTAPATVNLGSYVLSTDPSVPVTASFVVTASTTTATTYTATPTLGSSAWFGVTCASGTATTTLGDICTIVVNSSVVDGLTGTATDTIVLQPVNSSSNPIGTPFSVTVNLTLTSTASTLATASTIVLNYVSNGLANQAGAKQSGTITTSDSSLESYTVTNTLPSWLTATPTAGQIASGGSDTVLFSVVQSGANSLPAGVTTFTVNLAISTEGVLPVVVTLNVIAAQPLSLATSSPLVDFGYVRGGSVSSSAIDAVVQYVGPTSTIAYTVNAATVPVWLAVSATSPATSSGVNVAFTMQAAVVPGLAAGNYTASVFLTAVGASSSLSVPVVLTVSNTAATMSIKEGTTTIPAIFTMSASPVVPTPTVTVVSSDEPISFDATCTVSTTNPTYVGSSTSCQLKGASTESASVSGVAYTWGTPLTAVFDSALFATNTPYGSLINLAVTVHSTSLTTPATLTLHYTYSIQPAAPTFTALSPTSANAIATGTSLIVTLTGTNFVGSGNIVGSAISPTKVYAGTTDITADSVVINSTTIAVSVPQSTFPTLSGSTTHASLTLGVANQTGASAPTAATATQTLTVTTSPVVYGITSTATYVQPLPGAKPRLAPFELISIFGANFTTGSPVSGATDAFGRFGTSVTLSGSGSSAVNLSVGFKNGTTTYPAPILYASATQINAIIPSQLPTGTATVLITSGTLVSDGTFAITVVPADPGIFTLSSEGVGQGAILNADGTVNQVGNETTAASYVSIYMTGLGAPNSLGVDASSNTAGYPAGCVELSGTTSLPGYLQVANTAGSAESPAFTYTKPTTAWTNLDGVVINPILLLDSNHLAPCFTTGSSGSTTVSVIFGTGSSAITQTGNTAVPWAGFAPGSVAGLYQINVVIPSGLASSGATTVPVQVVLGTEGSSPAGVVTMAVK